jgi:hypothetical protein
MNSPGKEQPEVTNDSSTPAQTLQAIDVKLKTGVPWLAGITANYRFELSGDGGGTFSLTVRDGVGSAGPGSTENPDVTFSMTAATFMKMKDGTIDDGALAFLNGEVTMDGDQSLAIALAPLWFDRVDVLSYADHLES